jgi:hypothetical protein
VAVVVGITAEALELGWNISGDLIRLNWRVGDVWLSGVELPLTSAVEAEHALLAGIANAVSIAVPVPIPTTGGH